MPYRTPADVARRKAEMRAGILAAAARLIAANGYAATTVQQIVREAGTSVGNCYFYFPDKAALFLALLEEISAEIGRAVDAALAQVPPGPAQLAVAVYTGVTALLERGDLAGVILVEANQPAFRAVALNHFTDRVQRFFGAHPELCGAGGPTFAAYAWQGAIFNVLEGVITQHIPGDPAMIGRQLARWNLQAVGLPADQVEQALAVLDG